MKNLINSILRKTEFNIETVSAHCDIPCGVYETDSMTHAAQTVFALTEKLLELEEPTDKSSRLEYVNTVSRMVAVKEEYAQVCKDEILILWTDYFKPEHFEANPELTNKILAATKQCAEVKRAVNLEAAQKLKDMVAEVAEIFKSTQ